MEETIQLRLMQPLTPGYEGMNSAQPLASAEQGQKLPSQVYVGSPDVSVSSSITKGTCRRASSSNTQVPTVPTVPSSQAQQFESSDALESPSVASSVYVPPITKPKHQTHQLPTLQEQIVPSPSRHGNSLNQQLIMMNAGLQGPQANIHSPMPQAAPMDVHNPLRSAAPINNLHNPMGQSAPMNFHNPMRQTVPINHHHPIRQTLPVSCHDSVAPALHLNVRNPASPVPPVNTCNPGQNVIPISTNYTQVNQTQNYPGQETHYPPNSQPAIVSPPRIAFQSSTMEPFNAQASKGLTIRRQNSSILEDVTFAPPPPLPRSLEILRSEIQHNRQLLSRLPSFERITHSGTCLARFSLKSMLMKKWKPAFWITMGESKVIFFRSKEDFEECFTNPYLRDDQREKLVKFSCDFVEDLDMNHFNGYRITRQSTKVYSRDGMVHQFKLEKWYSYGPNVSAAIGGKSEHEVGSLRSIMTEMINLSPQTVLGDPREDLSSHYDSDGGQSFNSARYSTYSSYSGKSAMSAPTQPTRAYSRNHQNVEAHEPWRAHNNGQVVYRQQGSASYRNY